MPLSTFKHIRGSGCSDGETGTRLQLIMDKCPFACQQLFLPCPTRVAGESSQHHQPDPRRQGSFRNQP
jgi:hypothetical protein